MFICDCVMVKIKTSDVDMLVNSTITKYRHSYEEFNITPEMVSVLMIIFEKKATSDMVGDWFRFCSKGKQVKNTQDYLTKEMDDDFRKILRIKGNREKLEKLNEYAEHIGK